MEEIIDTGKNTFAARRTFKVRYVAFLQRNWSWLLAVAIAFVFMMLAAMIMNVAPFGRNSFSCIDSMHQYVPFFSDYQRKARGLESIFYTWNIGMGQNFFSLVLYYMASPLNLIMLLFPTSGIFTGFTLILIIKICFSAGAFGYWLSRRRGAPSNNLLITAFSLGFAINNYTMGYYWNIMWLDCIMMLPLAILGLERIFRGESPKLYVLSLFYILYCNYYIAFIICIFLVLWFFAHRQGSVRGFFRNGLVFAGCSILSAAMAAFALFSAFLGIMATSSADNMGLPKNEMYGSFYTQLKQLFFMTTPVDMQNDDSGLNVYCGVLTVLLFFLFLLCDRISLAEKIRKLLLIVFLTYSFNSTLLNFIWHGFHNQYGIPNRFSFVFIFTLLTIGYEALMRLRQTGIFQVAMAGSLTILFYLLCFLFGNPDGLVSGGWIFGITIALVVGYMVVFFFRHRNRKCLVTTSVILFSAMMLELFTTEALGFFKNDVANGGYYSEHLAGMQAAKRNVDRYAAVNGITFWREDQISTRMIDEATYNGLRSVGTFCSTVNGKLVETMGRLGCYTGVNEFLFYGGNPVLNMLTGVRFLYSRTGDYAAVGTERAPLYEEKGYAVYENPYTLPIGYGTSSDLLEWTARSGDRLKAVNELAFTISGIRNVYEEVRPEITVDGKDCKTWVTSPTSYLINYTRTGEAAPRIHASFSVDQDGHYLFDTKVNHVNKSTLYINGEKKIRERLTTQIFDLGKLSKGDTVELEFEFEKDATDHGTISLFVNRVNEDKLKAIYDVLADEPLTVTYAKDGKLDGVINMKEDGILFTTIPYDKGWCAEVDGEKAEILAVSDSFVALSLTKGQHEVRFRYISPGFLPGLMVSCAGWLVFTILCFVWKRRPRNMRYDATGYHCRRRPVRKAVGRRTDAEDLTDPEDEKDEEEEESADP